MPSSFLRFHVFFLLCIVLTVRIPPSHADDSVTREHQVHDLVNAHRTAMGLAPFTYNEEVAVVARQHSQNIAKGIVGHGHAGADERGQMLLRIIPYVEFGENVGGNNHSAASTAKAAVTGWLNSPHHRENIEGNFDTTGIGIARGGSTFFFTQIFLKTQRGSRSPINTHRPQERPRIQPYTAEEEPAERPRRQQRAYVPAPEREESDPRKRPGRKRVRGGYVQDLEEDN
ncbi:MAG: CAP domain-containing protein [Deltaproteobacteria bacterium]|nr:CAP domain-containing protein [Deltaproteobacteria bacterium]